MALSLMAHQAAGAMTRLCAAIMDEHQRHHCWMVVYELRIRAHAIEHSQCASSNIWQWGGHAPIGAGEGHSGNSIQYML